MTPAGPAAGSFLKAVAYRVTTLSEAMRNSSTCQGVMKATVKGLLRALARWEMLSKDLKANSLLFLSHCPRLC